MSDFADKLAALTSREAADAHGDADRLGMMIERLSAALGFTIAMAARGDPATIDEMVAGAEGYAHAEAVAKAPLAVFMHRTRSMR